MINQAQRSAENFSRMLEHVSGGLCPDGVTSADLKHAARGCGRCAQTDVCESWLDQVRRSERHAPGFCPDAAGVWSRIAAG